MTLFGRVTAAVGRRAKHRNPYGASPQRQGAAGRAVEALETRRLFAVAVVDTIPSVTARSGEAVTPIDLTAYIDDPAINTQVRFTTPLGNVDLELFDSQKPNTVNNFLDYVRTNKYNGTIIHRSTAASTGLQVIQGGGYTLPVLPVTHIPTNPPVAHEGATLSNLRGTISMARTSDPNSATSEFFINTVDNSSVLDAAAQPPGYVVFGQVINNTMTAVDAIKALPTFEAIDPYGEIPLRDYTQADLEANRLPTADNVVGLTAVTLPKLTYTAQSDNPLVTPTIDGNRVNLQVGQGEGTALITVTGANAANQSATSTFAVTVTAGLAVTLGAADGPTSVTFTDADGTRATVSLKGSGTATVNLGGNGLTSATRGKRATVSGEVGEVDSIAVTGTNASTTLTITGRGGSDGLVTLQGLTLDGGAKAVAATGASLVDGTLTTGAAVGRFDLGRGQGGTITLGGAATDAPAVVKLGDVVDTDLSSNAPIRSLTANGFAAAGNAAAASGTLSAPTIGPVVVRGNMTQNVTTDAIRSLAVGGNLAGSTVTTDSLGAVKVRGDLAASAITVERPFAAGERPLAVLNVRGAMTDTDVRVTGNIGTVAANSMSGSTVLAGVAANVLVTTLPNAANQFASQASIAGVRVRDTFATSNVSAFNLGRVSLGTVGANSAANGLAAGTIASAVGRTPTGERFNLRRLDTASDLQEQTEGLTLGITVNLV